MVKILIIKREKQVIHNDIAHQAQTHVRYHFLNPDWLCFQVIPPSLYIRHVILWYVVVHQKNLPLEDLLW